MNEIHTVLTKEDMLLTIPWFLNCNNPEVIARREASKAAWRNERKTVEKRKPTTVRMRRTKPKSAPVAPASKPAAVAAPKAAKASAYADSAVITVLVESFPHRAGSQAESKSALLETGQTVAEYKAAGASLGLKGNWHIAHIKYCVNYNLISVEG